MVTKLCGREEVERKGSNILQKNEIMEKKVRSTLYHHITLTKNKKNKQRKEMNDGNKTIYWVKQDGDEREGTHIISISITLSYILPI